MTDFVEQDNLDIPTFLDRRDVACAGSWRDHLKIHPAADLFPMMSESELRELGENIKAQGLKSHLKLYKGKLLDGRNRLEAMELVGIPVNLSGDVAALGCPFDHLDERADPYDHVIALNLHRRHLTADQKRDLIAKVLKAKPEASNNQIAKQTKTSDKTVAKVRGKLESTSEIPKLEKTTGKDGKARRKSIDRKKHKEVTQAIADGVAGDACVMQTIEAERAAGSAEVSIEERRAQNATLADGDDDGLMSAVDNANTFAALFGGIIRDCPPSQKRMAALLKPVERAASAWFKIKADLETRLHAEKKKGA
jgi:hypothetical protein